MMAFCTHGNWHLNHRDTSFVSLWKEQMNKALYMSHIVEFCNLFSNHHQQEVIISALPVTSFLVTNTREQPFSLSLLCMSKQIKFFRNNNNVKNILDINASGPWQKMSLTSISGKCMIYFKGRRFSQVWLSSPVFAYARQHPASGKTWIHILLQGWHQLQMVMIIIPLRQQGNLS